MMDLANETRVEGGGRVARGPPDLSDVSLTMPTILHGALYCGGKDTSSSRGSLSRSESWLLATSHAEVARGRSK